MMADRIAGGDLTPDQRWMRSGIAADQKEGRMHALIRERFEDERRRLR